LHRKYLRVFKTISVRERMFKMHTCRSPRYGPEIGTMLMVFVVGCAFALVSCVLQCQSSLRKHALT
jgi:hypothetical protein